MDENTNATMPSDEIEPLMPDGWQDGDDLFGESSEEAAEVETDAEPETGPTESEDATPDSDEPPTTAESEEPGAEDTEAAPTTEPDEVIPAEPNRLRFKARIDHEDRDVEVDEAELPTLYQKAQATDRAQQRMQEMKQVNDRAEILAKQMGFQSADELFTSAAQNFREAEIEKLVDEGTARSVAEFIVDARMGQAGTIPASTHPEPTPATSAAPAANPYGEQANAPVAQGQNGQRDFGAEVQELLQARPQLVGKPLPEEVANAAVAGGKRLVDAYLDYEAAGAKREAERLRKENHVLKQNADAAKRAPVKGTTGGGKTDTRPSDPFLEGFNSDKW